MCSTFKENEDVKWGLDFFSSPKTVKIYILQLKKTDGFSETFFCLDSFLGFSRL